jgi:hypothetical protein
LPIGLQRSNEVNVRKLFRLMAAGAFLVLALVLPSRTSEARDCIYWFDEYGYCYYSCYPCCDGYC